VGGIIPEIVFPASLVKTYLHDFTGTLGAAERQVDQPVIYIEAVTASGTTSSVTFTSIRLSVGSAAIGTSHILWIQTIN
jgi:hypothetical protein